MPQEQLPLLIFAQTARFIAQSAAQLGYQTWVADCFADTDTQRVSDRLVHLPSLDQLTTDSLLSSLHSLSQQQPCWLIFGAGIERFYPVLKQLPPHIQPLGNNFQTFELLRSADQFFPLLDELGIAYPETHFISPADKNKIWLNKNLKSCGGSHIKYANHHPDNQVIFQEYIEGTSASVSFIADGYAASILGFNKQIHDKQSFVLQQLINQIDLTPSSIQKVATALQRLITATGFKGFGSLDFLVDDADNIYILELNPRISASAELYSNSGDILHSHIQASMGILPDELGYTYKHSTNTRALSYLFADKHYRARENTNWPSQAHDIPSSSQMIYPGQPICTLIIDAKSEQACQNIRHQLETEIVKNCLYSA
ncbi:ATP-grasp domain-containing protein [Methylophaga sulfidovorans]|uniref:Predicted ATP-dependent carboligase, ATP-grasp superfamily n=1 Tax=Methylophaga sulfidovorans TaxID=45496 RepID=A0A1I3X3D6_9GAMM|nr:ATP-grasp domain-containing protein [Methylophaga sulfidovorans]SFK13737.1 Predicted ATP-dependent carboligase, ATP-grasp superfamily [Methylophaga sulfidovorans]